MSDDLVKRLRDTPNWMREGFQDWKDNVRTYDRAPFEAADRIEELEAENHLLKNSGIVEVAVRNPNVMEYMRHWEGRAEAAEAKLAKAVEALEECVEEIDAYIQHQYPHDHPVQERHRQQDYASNPARLALAELKGQDDA